MRIVVLAAHTDDAEVGVGGTMINLLQDGHEVIIGNMIVGDEKSRKFGLKAAKIIGAKVEWLDFKVMNLKDTNDSFKQVEGFLNKHKPDIIFAHWPVDEHPDHRAVSSLAIRYINDRQQQYIDKDGNIHAEKYCPQLLFYEVITGKQTKCFVPNLYVNFSKEIVEKKKRAMDIYAGSPKTLYGKSWYTHQILMMEFRGRESGVCRHAEIDKGIWAEAFITYPIPRGQKNIIACAKISLRV